MAKKSRRRKTEVELIRLLCSCGKRVKVSIRFAGKKGKCPRCGSHLNIPDLREIEREREKKEREKRDSSILSPLKELSLDNYSASPEMSDSIATSALLGSKEIYSAQEICSEDEVGDVTEAELIKDKWMDSEDPPRRATERDRVLRAPQKQPAVEVLPAPIEEEMPEAIEPLDVEAMLAAEIAQDAEFAAPAADVEIAVFAQEEDGDAEDALPVQEEKPWKATPVDEKESLDRFFEVNAPEIDVEVSVEGDRPEAWGDAVPVSITEEKVWEGSPHFAECLEAAEFAELAEAAEFAELAESAEAAEFAELAESVEPADSGVPVERAGFPEISERPEPAELAEIPEFAESAEHDEPGNYSELEKFEEIEDFDESSSSERDVQTADKQEEEEEEEEWEELDSKLIVAEDIPSDVIEALPVSSIHEVPESEDSSHAIEEATDIGSISGGEILERGKAALESENLDEALQYFSQCIASQEDLGAAYYLRAVLYAKKRAWELSVEDLDNARICGCPEEDVDKKIKQVKLLRACQHRSSGAYSEALADIEQISSNSASVEKGKVHWTRAKFLMRCKAWDSAMEDIEKAIEYNYLQPHVYEAGGKLSLFRGEFETAMNYFTAAISRGGKSASIYHARGEANLSLGHFEEALADIRQAQQLAPDFAALYDLEGLALNELKSYEQADKAFQRAFELDPNDSARHFHRAMAYMRRGRHSSAIENFSRVLERNPKDRMAYLKRAICYQEKVNPNLAQAREDIKKVEELEREGLYRSGVQRSLGETAG